MTRDHYVQPQPSPPPPKFAGRMTATCGICGKRWDARDPGITRWWGTDEWACTEEALCFDRAAMNLITEGK